MKNSCITAQAKACGSVINIAYHKFIVILICMVCILAGCRTPGTHSQTNKSRRGQPLVRRLACLYEKKPWLTNLDIAGDLDPEGIKFRAFLDPGTGKGVWLTGMFKIEMYKIDRNARGEYTRTLVSDWIYPSSKINRLHSKILGNGYHFLLRWHSKDLAGHEIELVTQFEDANGWIARASTKRFSIPKYPL